jgi:hypothetical protein
VRGYKTHTLLPLSQFLPPLTSATLKLLGARLAKRDYDFYAHIYASKHHKSLHVKTLLNVKCYDEKEITCGIRAPLRRAAVKFNENLASL